MGEVIYGQEFLYLDLIPNEYKLFYFYFFLSCNVTAVIL